MIFIEKFGVFVYFVSLFYSKHPSVVLSLQKKNKGYYMKMIKLLLVYLFYIASLQATEENPTENRYLRSLYKTKLCKFHSAGKPCSYGERCHFAHGEDELVNYRHRYSEKSDDNICFAFLSMGVCKNKNCKKIHTKGWDAGNDSFYADPVIDNILKKIAKKDQIQFSIQYDLDRSGKPIFRQSWKDFCTVVCNEASHEQIERDTYVQLKNKSVSLQVLSHLVSKIPMPKKFKPNYFYCGKPVRQIGQYYFKLDHSSSPYTLELLPLGSKLDKIDKSKFVVVKANVAVLSALNDHNACQKFIGVWFDIPSADIIRITKQNKYLNNPYNLKGSPNFILFKSQDDNANELMRKVLMFKSVVLICMADHLLDGIGHLWDKEMQLIKEYQNLNRLEVFKRLNFDTDSDLSL